MKIEWIWFEFCWVCPDDDDDDDYENNYERALITNEYKVLSFIHIQTTYMQ